MADNFTVFVGVDWGRAHHEVCVVDAQGKLVAGRGFKHDGEQMKELCEWLATRGEASSIAIGIETSSGPVVEALLERGFALFSLNPKQLDRFRDRFTMAGCKDDRLDARVLAESLRTDLARFRPLRLPPAQVLELRECSRLRDELQRERQRWLNRLRDQLWRYFPAMLELTEDIATDWFLELCTMVPSPAEAKDVPTERIEVLLKKHRVRCIDAATLLQRLRVRPLSIPAAVTAAAQECVGICVAQLQLLNQQHRRTLRRLVRLTAQLAQEQKNQEQRDVEILQSLPGVGRVVLAALITEAYEPLRSRNYHALRALSGVAPVTRRSGKSLSVHRRRACNPLLRDALYHWSRVAMKNDPRSRQRYGCLRGRGKTHGHALRRLADHLLLMTCSLLRTGQLFDPAHPSQHQPGADDGRACGRPSSAAPRARRRRPQRETTAPP